MYGWHRLCSNAAAATASSSDPSRRLPPLQPHIDRLRWGCRQISLLWYQERVRARVLIENHYGKTDTRSSNVYHISSSLPRARASNIVFSRPSFCHEGLCRRQLIIIISVFKKSLPAVVFLFIRRRCCLPLIRGAIHRSSTPISARLCSASRFRF